MRVLVVTKLVEMKLLQLVTLTDALQLQSIIDRTHQRRNRDFR